MLGKWLNKVDYIHNYIKLPEFIMFICSNSMYSEEIEAVSVGLGNDKIRGCGGKIAKDDKIRVWEMTAWCLCEVDQGIVMRRFWEVFGDVSSCVGRIGIEIIIAKVFCASIKKNIYNNLPTLLCKLQC